MRRISIKLATTGERRAPGHIRSLLSLLSSCSVFEEHTAVQGAVFGADTALALWAGLARGTSWAIFAVGATGARGSRGTIGSGLAGLSVASGGAVVAGQTRWSGLSGWSGFSGGVRGGLGWSSGVSSWSIWARWSGRSIGARGTGGAGLTVVSGLARRSRSAAVARWSSWSRWAGWAGWAWVAWWDFDFLADNWWTSRATGSARCAGDSGLAVGSWVSCASGMTGAAATVASSLTLDDGSVGGDFHWLAGLGAHLLHDVTGR
jgi:hypothetical protein